MALYFAMIDGEQKGPFTLDELHEEGVRPDTYVWAKGMDDWKKADDVADICRYYRQRIFDRMHPSPKHPENENNVQSSREEFDEQKMRGLRGYPFPMPEEDPSRLQNPPMPTLGVAIAVLLLCFPPTGAIALYFSIMARKEWDKSVEISEGKVEGDADKFRRDAHNSARLAKMWIGITFFLGLIFYAFMVSMVG